MNRGVIHAGYDVHGVSHEPAADEGAVLVHSLSDDIGFQFFDPVPEAELVV
jgi:hypothetical protein